MLFEKLPLKGKKVVCLISGGNIDVNILSRVISRGLIMSGRNTHLRIELTDKPGQMELVSHIIAIHGANITAVFGGVDLDLRDAVFEGDVVVNATTDNKNITDCFLDLDIETRNLEHLMEIKTALREAGFQVSRR